MKYYVIVSVIFQITLAKSLPSYLESLTCSRFDPKYDECLLASLEEAKPYFTKGIRELNLPPLDPMVLPVMTVNRSINPLVNIDAVIRDVKITGFANTVIDSLKANPLNRTGEIRFTMPWAFMEMEYDVAGQILAIPLESKGYFKGNFTNTQGLVRVSFTTFKKEDGESYFRVDKMYVKMTVGDGWVKMTAKNPELQFGADLIANFFNANTRLFLDTINPIFIASVTDFYRALANQVLASVPQDAFFSD